MHTDKTFGSIFIFIDIIILNIEHNQQSPKKKSTAQNLIQPNNPHNIRYILTNSIGYRHTYFSPENAALDKTREMIDNMQISLYYLSLKYSLTSRGIGSAINQIAHPIRVHNRAHSKERGKGKLSARQYALQSLALRYTYFLAIGRGGGTWIIRINLC